MRSIEDDLRVLMRATIDCRTWTPYGMGMDSRPIPIHPRISGRDLEGDLPIPASDAQVGSEVLLALHRGGPVPEEVALKIPAGIADGARLRLAGMGLSQGEGEAGSLILTISVLAPVGPRVVEAEVLPPAGDRKPASAVDASASSPPSQEPSPSLPVTAQDDQAIASAPERETSTVVPSPSDGPSASGVQSLITKGLWLTFVLVVAFQIWGWNSNWMRSFDRPTPETMLARSGEPLVFTVNTPQQSIKGYYRVQSMNATLRFDDGTAPIPITVTDLGGRNWGETINYKTLAATAELATPNESIALRFKTELPSDVHFIEKVGTIDLDMSIEFPWFIRDEGNKPGFEDKSWPLRHTVPIKMVAHDHETLAVQVRRIVGLLFFGLIIFAIVRMSAGTRVQIIAAIVLTVAGLVAHTLIENHFREKRAAQNPVQNPAPNPAPKSTSEITPDPTSAEPISGSESPVETAVTPTVVEPEPTVPVPGSDEFGRDWSEIQQVSYQLGTLFFTDAAIRERLNHFAFAAGVQDLQAGKGLRLGALQADELQQISEMEKRPQDFDHGETGSDTDCTTSKPNEWTAWQRYSYIIGYAASAP